MLVAPQRRPLAGRRRIYGPPEAGPGLRRGRPQPGSDVTTCERHCGGDVTVRASARLASIAMDAPAVEHVCAALREPFARPGPAAAGEGHHDVRATQGTARARLAAIAARLRRQTRGPPGAGPPPAAAREGP